MLRCYSLPDYEIPAPDFLMATEVGSVDFRDNFYFFNFYFLGIGYTRLTMSLERYAFFSHFGNGAADSDAH